MRYLSSLAVCVALAACGSKDPAPTVSAGSGSAGSAVVTPPPASGALLQIYVNDESVAKVGAKEIAAWPRLDSLVPPANRRLGQWATLSLKTGSGPAEELKKPSDTYPDMVPALYPTKDGGVGFGMFDAVELAKKGTPAVHHEGLTEIRISIADNGRGQNEDGNDGGGDPTKLVLTFKLPAGDTAFTGDKLLALPREPVPGGQGEQKGWNLGKVMEAAGVKSFDKVLLGDASGTNVTLEKADFDAASSVPFLRLNKQGKLRFKLYKKKGDGWASSADLRALTTVQVLK